MKHKLGFKWLQILLHLMAKVHPYYGNDGTGRDTYIQSRNGGVFGKLH